MFAALVLLVATPMRTLAIMPVLPAWRWWRSYVPRRAANGAGAVATLLKALVIVVAAWAYLHIRISGKVET